MTTPVVPRPGKLDYAISFLVAPPDRGRDYMGLWALPGERSWRVVALHDRDIPLLYRTSHEAQLAAAREILAVLNRGL